MSIDLIIWAGILLGGTALFIYLLNKSIKKPIIAYLLLQFTVVWIFFGQKILAPIGLNFKPHAIVFLLATLISIYFIFKNFDELWSYKHFRYLFIFFLISSVYALFYKSDFRSSSYIDLWIHNNLGLRHNAIGAGHGEITREFGSTETQYIIYLAGLAPLISFLTGFFAFKNLSGKLQSTLQNFISAFSLITLVYLIFLGLSILAGTSTLMFIDGRLAIDGEFTGNDFEGLFLIMLVGFYIYVQQHKDFKFHLPVKLSIIANIAILAVLILLGIKKGTILALFISYHAAMYLIPLVKLYNREKLPIKLNPVLIGGAISVIALVMLTCPEFIQTTIDNINERFSNNQTLDVRMANWELYTQHWVNNLNPFTVLCGFGIDSSREVTFFLSAMHPDPSMQQPHIHNIYLEMFYNYGLIAILFFLPFILMFFEGIKAILINKYDVFHCISITVILFFLIYHVTESPAVPSIIMIFSLIGFFESVRRATDEEKKENPVLN